MNTLILDLAAAQVGVWADPDMLAGDRWVGLWSRG